jgi:hypothetical protein
VGIGILSGIVDAVAGHIVDVDFLMIETGVDIFNLPDEGRNGVLHFDDALRLIKGGKILGTNGEEIGSLLIRVVLGETLILTAEDIVIAVTGKEILIPGHIPDRIAGIGIIQAHTYVASVQRVEIDLVYRSGGSHDGGK